MATDAEFMTVQDVAIRLDVSERTVRRMVDDGELDGIRVRRQIRVTKTSYMEFTKKVCDSSGSSGTTDIF